MVIMMVTVVGSEVYNGDNDGHDGGYHGGYNGGSVVTAVGSDGYGGR